MTSQLAIAIQLAICELDIHAIQGIAKNPYILYTLWQEVSLCEYLEFLESEILQDKDYIAYFQFYSLMLFVWYV